MGFAQILYNLTDREVDGLKLQRRLSDAEEQCFLQAEPQLQQLGFDIENKQNFLTLWNAFDKSPQTPINVANIVETAKAHRGSFTWRTAVEQEYDKLAVKFPNQADRDYIARKIGLAGYAVEPESDLLHNFNLVAKAFLAKYPNGGFTVDERTFQIVFGNLAAGPQGDQLRKKAQPSKFNAQAAVQAQEESRKTFQRDESQLIVSHRGEHPDSWVRPLSPELRAHREANARAMAQAEEAKHKAQPETSDSDYWKGRVEQYLTSIRENNIREYLQQEFGNQPKNGSWSFGWRVLDNTYIRIKNQGLATYLAEQAEKA